MSSVEELSISSLGARMQKVFDLPSLPLECSTEDRILIAQKRASQAGKDLDYPILAYSLTDMSPAQWANPTVMAYSLKRTSATRDFVNALSLYPHVFSFDITYLDNSRDRLIKFLSAWGRAGIEGLLNFRLLIDGMPVDIQVKPDPSISVPKRDVTVDVSSQYEFTSHLTMSSYLSGPFKDSIKKLARIKETTVSFALLPESVDAPSDPYGSGPTPPVELVEATLANYNDSVRTDNLLFDIVMNMQTGDQVMVLPDGTRTSLPYVDDPVPPSNTPGL